MNRRRFLGLLAGASVATATSYFFAPVGGWKSDVIANPEPTSYRFKYFTGIDYGVGPSTSVVLVFRMRDGVYELSSHDGVKKLSGEWTRVPLYSRSGALLS